MDLDAFVTEHVGEWRRLEHLAGRRRRKLSAAEVDELVALYQRAATHLSLIRSRSPDAALVARLSRLVLSARGALTGSPTRFWYGIGRFFTLSFPAAAYRAWPWWAGVLVVNVAVAGFLMAYVAANPEVALAFLSQSQIDQLVETSFESYYSENAPQNFAFAVWTNNARLAALCLASGVLILPVVYVLGLNIFNLGLVGGIMIGNGRSDVFFGLILVHGMLELTCIFVAAGVGLRIGWAWIAPGQSRTRGQALAEAARSGMVVALGLAVVLLVAGIIEAFVTPYLPAVIGLTVGGLAWLGFLAYVVILGRSAAEVGETGDLEESDRPAVAPSV
jgi:uncharacterized membrane protein SpoIIM required for sporulation